MEGGRSVHQSCARVLGWGAASGTASPRTRHCEGGVWTLSAVPLLRPSRVLGHSSALQVPRALGSSLILAATFRVHPWGASTPLQPGVLAKVKSCGLSAVDGTGWACSGSRNAETGCRSCRVNRLTGVWSDTARGWRPGLPLELDSTEVSVWKGGGFSQMPPVFAYSYHPGGERGSFKETQVLRQRPRTGLTMTSGSLA